MNEQMKKIVLSSLILFFCFKAISKDYRLVSPDERLSAEITVEENVSVTVSENGRFLFGLSGLSMEFEGENVGKDDIKVKKTKSSNVNETVIPVIREKSGSYQDMYNGLTVELKTGTSLDFRLYNEGFAYRISTAEKDSLTVLKENLQVKFERGDSARFQASRSFVSNWETPYEHWQMDEIEKGRLINLPVLVKKGNGPFVMFAESDLFDFPGLWALSTGSDLLEITHAPFPKRLNYDGNIYGQGKVAETEDFIAKVKGTRTFPWRIFAVAEDESGLVTNNLVYLLSTPTELKDVSWIKPGVVMFDWWGKFNVYGVDFKTGINTETAKYFIDFCAEKGFRYFLFDDGWCPKENLLTPVPELDMDEVTAYAKEKGVDVMLWVIWSSLQRQWDEAFDQFEKWGIKGIKMDFMDRDDQQMVAFYEAVAKKAAEKKMVVNFHGAYKPSGLRRKYPNVLTREALIEFEYNGWTNHDNPEHHNLLPYIRMFTGPMDYIPATMRNSNAHNFRPVSDYPMGQGTRAHAMALFVILNSPMTMLPDSPSDYYRENECTEFIKSIPVEWDETRLLKGEIGKYTVLARRSGKTWHIGAITNSNAREIDLPLDFLGEGKYHIEMIEDGMNAATRASDYKKVENEVVRSKSLHLKLAPGGGWLARIRPVE